MGWSILLAVPVSKRFIMEISPSLTSSLKRSFLMWKLKGVLEINQD
jgi:hypothetical protein